MLALCIPCQENVILSMYVSFLRFFFLLPNPKGLSLTDMLLLVSEACVAGGHLFSSFMKTFGIISCKKTVAGVPEEEGRERSVAGEEREVLAKNANSFCITEKGTDKAG